MIRWRGLKLGHQMMVGLPDSTRLDEINTAKELIKLKPKMVRIYPVLVIKNTKLEKEFLEEKYTPLTVVQAVETCKELVAMFNKKGIEVIRVGLQNTDEITDPNIEGSEVVAGPYHPPCGCQILFPNYLEKETVLVAVSARTLAPSTTSITA